MGYTNQTSGGCGAYPRDARIVEDILRIKPIITIIYNIQYSIKERSPSTGTWYQVMENLVLGHTEINKLIN